ncbi:hypothetical protein A1UA_01776 [Escherichia coli KTE69]|nr:hypothetical protein A1YW_02108 [Escherichia coli KTE143]EOV66945.1 hypothetical protein A1UA_01776 [Escherichia coli KTE69]EOV76610.1 hypothetical protein A1UC_01990 [Escherichia coli KTE70]EQQ12332.1 hypothetical protein G749_01552 [Escherichia coli HVH 87 (4-5977630)]
MKLHHRMLRHFIAASVIVLTSSFLIFELVASDRAMSAYLRYIVQRADSSFLYDKYQNQSIAAHVMRALAAEQSEVSPEQRRAGNDSNLLIVFYVQIMPDDFVMQLHRF